MAVTYNIKRFVTDGLFLYLDAGNIKSYSGTGTSWFDISGTGKVATLTNGPTYNSANGGSFGFDGVDDFAPVTGATTVTAATFIAWIKRNGSQGDYDGLIFSRTGSTTGMALAYSNAINYHWNNAANTYSWNSGLQTPNLTWCMCALSVNATAAVAYLGQSSGITTATNTVTHGSTSLNGVQIARDSQGLSSGGRLFTGDIAVACIYNRDLSSAEISQNFSALRGRFGV